MRASILALLAVLPLSFANAIEVRIDCADPNVFCMEEFNAIAAQSPSIETAIDRLPVYLKRNVTFKRGNNMSKRTVGIMGPHGHKVSDSDSGSASPAQPRLFVWDEKTGFTASWNSGNPDHNAHDRMDFYDFDFDTKEHRLMAWTAGGGGKFHDATLVDGTGRSCINCHGQVQRPIFPMYPDWPQFYGEFNDEMTGYPGAAAALRSDLKVMANEFQPAERRLYANFLANEGRSNPRFSLIFNSRPSNSTGNSVYPYRPRTTTSPFSDTSRAFFHRPNLRLGVLYNRLTALQTFEKIKKSPVFKKFPDVIFYSLLDCNWDFVAGHGQRGREQILGKMLEVARQQPGLADLELRGAKFSASEVRSSERNQFFSEVENGQTVFYKHRKYTDPLYRQVPYEDLLKVLGLDIADMDIRFRHDSNFKVARGYGVYDPKAYYFTDSAMDIGYTEPRYAMNPICDNRGSRCDFSYNGTYMEGMRYFNSYFDGSATTNELLAAQMLLYLTDRNQDFSSEPDLRHVREILRARFPNPARYFETLRQKYSHYSARLALDNAFFEKMDAIGPWIQLPYPPDLLNIQNRESFWGDSARTTGIRLRHAQWSSLQNRAADRKNLNGGNNLCWNVYASMNERYRR